MSDFITGSLLKKLRNDSNYSMQKIAALVGVSKAAVSKWENGYDISIDNLLQLSKIYNITVNELLCGRLNSENNSDFWKRNYNLSFYDFNEEISNNNLTYFKVLIGHCNMVKERFFSLLPRWAMEDLNLVELEEFMYIKQYFKFDADYSYIYDVQDFCFFVDENKERKTIIDVLDRIKSMNKESYMWELTKLYDFTYDIRLEEICDYENLKAFEYVIPILSQIQKDTILYNKLFFKEPQDINNLVIGYSIKEKSVEDIESDPFIKAIVNSGANMLYNGGSLGAILDTELFDVVQGRKETLCCYNFGMYQNSILSDWKKYSLDDYLSFVSKEETEKIRDIVNLREIDPLKYYNNLKERDQIKQ